MNVYFRSARFPAKLLAGGRLAARVGVWICAAALLAASFGCSKRATSAGASEASAKSGEQRFPLTGEILSVNAAEKTLRVQHGEIKGYMPAMTMEFAVSDGDFAIAKPGQHIRAELVTDGKGDFRLEKIWPADPREVAAVEAAAKSLTQDTVIRGKNAYREVGENAPEFALFDQEGRVVKSDRFRGKQIMLNFIFTRCPIPTMCPAATARFQETQKAAREAGVPNLELISITLDPAYDTPGVLKEYALARSIDTSNFTFLTGPEGAIESLLAQFGVLAELEGGLVKHTLATLLIDENGRIVHRADGSMWDVQDFVEKMKKG